MAVSVQTDMATPALHRFGSDELKQRYLTPAMKGEMVAAIAVTEPDAGSDVAGIRTRAVRDGDEWVINGTKLYITNGVQADWLCLLVRTSEEGGYRGMSQILFPTDAAGFSVSRKLDKLGQRSSDTAELSFVDARVPVANTIGDVGRGFQQQMAQFQNERLIAAYMAAGNMRLALDRTVAYVRERQAFGRSLADNQWIQFRLAELVAEVDLLRQYNYACAEAIVAEADPVVVTKMASIAKLKSGRLQREVADWCMQFHGGIGYMEETWTARYFRDSRLLSIGGGADEVMLRIIAQLEGIGNG
jgi:citronellyl-CoA dehydrogenase